MVTPQEEKGSLSTALNARTVGSGSETIVLAHGFGTDQSVWDDVVPMLAQHCRLVLFDWPFAGAVKDRSLYEPAKYESFEAFADVLIALMGEMELKDVTFAGHSMSAMIGCIASIKKPTLFKSLILICASPRYLNTEGYEGGFASSNVEQLFSDIETDYEKWVSGFSGFAVDPNDAVSREKFEKCLLRITGDVALPLAKTVFLSDYRDLLEKVEIPCTIVQPSNDRAVPHSVALYLANKIKAKCNLVIIDTVGHFPQFTAHLELVEVIKTALI